MTAFDPMFDTSQPAADRRELAMLRHDIGHTIGAVMSGLRQLETAEVPGPARQQLDRVTAAARSLARLLDVLLPDRQDALASDSAVVDVPRLVGHLRRRHAAEARERGLELIVEAAEDGPRALRLDPVLVERVLDNLVGNAVKFARGGAVRVLVGREPDGSVGIRVSDQGPGFDAAELAAIVRSEAAPPPGQGLGLHIVRVLTERLGGAFVLANRPAGGAEALLRFPADVAIAGRSPFAGSGPDLRGLRILLAEDNPTNQMVASQMLRALNAEVTICGDGIEALEAFERGRFDLVIVDIEMPRMSGLDVIRAIRRRTDDRAQVPIVALTAYAMREHRDRIAAAGANGLISKPVTSVEALGRELATHLSLVRPAAAATPAAAARADKGRAQPMVDPETYAALCDAIGPELIGELLDKVIVDLLGARRDLASALAPLDRAPIRAASHILISVAGALGALRLQACAKVVNTAAPAGPAEALGAEVARCMAEIDLAVAFARERRAECGNAA
jgi:CheY-like chemotaxis protein/anti-sigma regulatory factor (Ser/Thr protein kinase)